MAYCRYGDHSDVYLYRHISGDLRCCECNLRKEDKVLVEVNDKEIETSHYGDEELEDIEHALRHLNVHRENGDKVPEYAFERLQNELE